MAGLSDPAASSGAGEYRGSPLSAPENPVQGTQKHDIRVASEQTIVQIILVLFPRLSITLLLCEQSLDSCDQLRGRVPSVFCIQVFTPARTVLPGNRFTWLKFTSKKSAVSFKVTG